jgi:hypothetical protein
MYLSENIPLSNPAMDSSGAEGVSKQTQSGQQVQGSGIIKHASLSTFWQLFLIINLPL